MLSRFVLLLLGWLACFSLSDCAGEISQSQRQKSIIDIHGQTVLIPEEVNKVIGLNSGSMRFLSYLGAIHMVAGVEETETRATRPYNFAYPEIHQKPVIGPQPGGDAELILKASPDVIFWSGGSNAKGSAQDLTQKTGIPVIQIKNGELGVENETIFQTLRIVGQALNKEKRAEEVIRYIQDNLTELRRRTANIIQHPSVYIGGLSNNGSKGLGSTRANFAPFILSKSHNVVSQAGYDANYTRPIHLDIEKLIEWNPDYIFLDADGWRIAQQELKAKASVFRNIRAVQKGHIYLIPRYINNSTSYDYALIDAWLVGKTLYPEKFQDIDLNKKSLEILEKMYGKSLKLEDFDLIFRKVDISEIQ